MRFDIDAVRHSLEAIPRAVVTSRDPRIPVPDWIGRTPALQVYGTPGQDVPNLIRETRQRRPNGEPQEPVKTVVAWPLFPPGQTVLLPEGWAEGGIDVLAYYLTFRSEPWRWGIYIRTQGVERIATRLAVEGIAGPAALEAAFDFLLGHELGHFKMDLMAASSELATATAMYLPAKARYRSASPGYCSTEEAVCNSLGRMALPPGKRRVLDEWLRLCPIGYRDFGKHLKVGQASWNDAMGALAHGPSSNSKSVPWTAVPKLSLDVIECVPVYLLVDGAIPSSEWASALIDPVQDITETPEFLKDVRRTGNEQQFLNRWQNRKELLAAGSLAGGSHLEKFGGNKWSVRVYDAARVGLVLGREGWLAVMADQQHDPFNKRFMKMDVSRWL